MQRQHGKTGTQVNHVVVFFFSPIVRIGDRYSRKCSDIIAGCITFTKYKVNSAIQCLQIVFFKSKNDESPAVYVHEFTPIMVRNNFHLFVLLGYLPRDYFGGNNKLYRSKFFFTLDFYLSFFNNFFKHKNYK